jgi:hypothetical protein
MAETMLRSRIQWAISLYSLLCEITNTVFVLPLHLESLLYTCRLWKNMVNICGSGSVSLLLNRDLVSSKS